MGLWFVFVTEMKIGEVVSDLPLESESESTPTLI